MSFNIINTQTYLTEEARALLLNNDCQIKYYPLENMLEDEICSVISGIDGVIAGGEHYNERVFQAADKLKIIARSGVGFDGVDLSAASKHGVWVTNTPDATSNAVADFTIGLILTLLRSIPAMIPVPVRQGTHFPQEAL